MYFDRNLPSEWCYEHVVRFITGMRVCLWRLCFQPQMAPVKSIPIPALRILKKKKANKSFMSRLSLLLYCVSFTRMHYVHLTCIHIHRRLCSPRSFAHMLMWSSSLPATLLVDYCLQPCSSLLSAPHAASRAFWGARPLLYPLHIPQGCLASYTIFLCCLALKCFVYSSNQMLFVTYKIVHSMMHSERIANSSLHNLSIFQLSIIIQKNCWLNINRSYWSLHFIMRELMSEVRSEFVVFPVVYPAVEPVPCAPGKTKLCSLG